MGMQSRANLGRLRLPENYSGYGSGSEQNVSAAPAPGKMYRLWQLRGAGAELRLQGCEVVHIWDGSGSIKTILDPAPAPSKMFQRLPASAPDKMCRLRWPGTGSASLLARLLSDPKRTLSDLEGPLRPRDRALSGLYRGPSHTLRDASHTLRDKSTLSDLGWTLMDQESPLRPRLGPSQT